jgi:gliding motility-associated-like protein
MVYNCTITTLQGCIQEDSIYIIVRDEESVIPNVFTPNYHKPNPTTGLFNDRFYIQGLSFYPNSKLEIYDRWGRPVLNTANYANNWDGGGQSDGVYFYVLTVKNGKKFKGFVQIIN